MHDWAGITLFQCRLDFCLPEMKIAILSTDVFGTVVRIAMTGIYQNKIAIIGLRS
jgi:hypothetical protein